MRRYILWVVGGVVGEGRCRGEGGEGICNVTDWRARADRGEYRGMVSSGRGVSIVSVEDWMRAGRRQYRVVGRSGEGRGRGI